MTSNDLLLVRISVQDGGEFVETRQPDLKSPDDYRECNQDYFRESFTERAPIYSECARVGRRALSWLTWIPGLSKNPVLDWANKEVSHEHISFDQSQDNIGFGQHGLFTEDTRTLKYRYEPDCYDGGRMRKAIAEVSPPKSYLGLLANCQSYIESVLERYLALGRSKDT